MSLFVYTEQKSLFKVLMFPDNYVFQAESSDKKVSVVCCLKYIRFLFFVIPANSSGGTCVHRKLDNVVAEPSYCSHLHCVV